MKSKKKRAKGAAPESAAMAAAAEGEFKNDVGTALAAAGVEVEQPKKRGRPRKQPDLPGVEGKGVGLNAVLEELCQNYNAAKVARCNMTTEETRTREELLAGLKAEDVSEYAWDGKVFYIAHKDETDTIKERKNKQPDYEAVGNESDD